MMSDKPENRTDPATEPEANPGQAAPEAPTTSVEPHERTEAERIADLEAEVAQLRDKWLRAEAEMQNLRNRARREAEEARLYGIQKFARDAVETAENLRRGLDSLPPAAAGEPEVMTKLRNGFEGVERAFLAMLERHGVQRQEAQGVAFDPELHQAMAEQPAPQGVEPGTVNGVFVAWNDALFT